MGGGILGNATELKYVGSKPIQGTECHEPLYCFPKENRWHMFVVAGDKPRLSEIRWENSIKEGGIDMRVSQAVMFENWSIDEPLSSSRFDVSKFEPAKEK